MRLLPNTTSRWNERITEKDISMCTFSFFLPNIHLAQFTSKWNQLECFNWYVSKPRVCWEWYAVFERQREHRVCPARKGYSTAFWLPLWNAKFRRSPGQTGSMTFLSHMNNTICVLAWCINARAYKCINREMQKGLNPTCPVCSVSSLLMRYIKKNLQRKDKQACCLSSMWIQLLLVFCSPREWVEGLNLSGLR